MKVTLSGVGSLIDATTAQNTINANSQTIENAFNNTLSLDGTQPNALNGLIDMNSNQIVNLPAPATANSPLRLQDLASFTGSGTIQTIPVGGTTGQSLQKTSNTDYATNWGNNVSSVGLALPADFTITNSPVTATGTLTGSWTTTPTGTGAVVRAVSPTITGHPTIEGITSTGATGTGNIVYATSPSLITPNIGAATATTVNKVTVTAPATSATLTITDGTVVTGPAATGTLVTKTSTDIFTNKTYDTAGAGNSFSINGVAATANTGTGSVVRATTPTLVTPVLGAATATTINGASLDNLAWSTYTPTVTAGAGTFTSASATGRYKQIGKTIHLQAYVTITTVGTAAGQTVITLPVTAAAFFYVGTAKESALTGKSGACQILASDGTKCQAIDSAGTTFNATGGTVNFGITYEVP